MAHSAVQPTGPRFQMQLECSICRNDLVVPDRLRRYYDMPVRCWTCRSVFTVTRSTPDHDPTPDDDAGGIQAGGQRLDRSISARHRHHMIACQHCGTELRVPGRKRSKPDSEGLTLTCPHCLATFCHHSIGTWEILDRLTIALVAALIFGGGLLWAEYEGLVELHNLGNGTWLAALHQMIAGLLAQLSTAAMARLV
ncbi:hypothetical protein AB3X55_12205 [Alphaproteobacteria bacterium LSUCC0719]